MEQGLFNPKKLVLVGDKIGDDGEKRKVSLLWAMANGRLPEAFVPDVFTGYGVDVEVDGKHVSKNHRKICES